MLVLTRRRMEKLYIGGDICVTVVRLEGGQVRLGIEAPRDIPVVRAELRERDRAAAAFETDNGEAVGADPAAISTAKRCWPLRSCPTSRSAETAEHGPDQACGISSASRNR